MQVHRITLIETAEDARRAVAMANITDAIHELPSEVLEELARVCAELTQSLERRRRGPTIELADKRPAVYGPTANGQ